MRSDFSLNSGQNTNQVRFGLKDYLRKDEEDGPNDATSSGSSTNLLGFRRVRSLEEKRAY